jgi:hypothetical protein
LRLTLGAGVTPAARRAGDYFFALFHRATPDTPTTPTRFNRSSSHKVRGCVFLYNR